jgi:dipeptidyl aminopeptidase/acylaminoacyl peptidase
MNKVLDELTSWATSAEEVTFTNDLKMLLGPRGELGARNSQAVRVFVFRYLSNGLIVSGFMVLPRDAADQPLPVIIYNRGGTRDFGFIKTGMLFTHIADLAQWGYVVIGSQYPGNSQSEGHDEWGGSDLQSVLDLHALIKHLSYADENRIGMFGASRGGMMTYLSLTRVDWLKAAVSVAGTSNLLRNADLRPEMQQVFTEAFGGRLEDKKRRSAVFWPERFPNTPLLIMHGTADWRVSPLDSIELAGKLYEHSKPFQLMIFADADHSLASYDEWQGQAKGWFSQFVK